MKIYSKLSNNATSKWCRRNANEFVMSRQDCRR